MAPLMGRLVMETNSNIALACSIAGSSTRMKPSHCKTKNRKKDSSYPESILADVDFKGSPFTVGFTLSVRLAKEVSLYCDVDSYI